MYHNAINVYKPGRSRMFEDVIATGNSRQRIGISMKG